MQSAGIPKTTPAMAGTASIFFDCHSEHNFSDIRGFQNYLLPKNPFAPKSECNVLVPP